MGEIRAPVFGQVPMFSIRPGPIFLNNSFFRDQIESVIKVLLHAAWVLVMGNTDYYILPWTLF